MRLRCKMAIQKLLLCQRRLVRLWSIRRGRRTLPEAARQNPRYLCEGSHGTDRIQSFCLTWHSKDHTARFVLRNGYSAGALKREHALGAIGSHASQQNAHAVAPSRLSYRSKHYINGRSLIADLGTLLQLNRIPSTGVPQQEVIITRCN